MAHECPNCWQTCFCNGDIDDCLFENTIEQNNCHHCPDEDEEGDDDYTVSDAIYGD